MTVRVADTQDQLDAQEYAETRVLCERRLAKFVEEAWRIVVPGEVLQWNWHMDAICQHLEAVTSLQIQNLLINVPPRTGKSTITSVMWPAWMWINFPSLRLLYTSYAQSLSTRDSLATRRLIESPWYQRRWADKFMVTTDQNEKTRYENNKRGYRLATSVGGANTGEGGDVIVADDPHNVKEGESEVSRDEVVRWWNEVMSTRGNNPVTARRVVVMQRVHEKDVAGDIIGKGGYVHLNIPQEFEPKFLVPVTSIGWKDPRTEEGDLLWPERYSASAIANLKRTMGTYAYAGQQQQHPSPLEGGMFKRGWWKYYRTDPRLLLEKARIKCWSWDMAFKDKDESDYVVGQAWAMVGADFYLIHQIRDHLSFTATKAAVKSASAKYPTIHAKLVEDKANGTAVIDDLAHLVGGLLPIEPEGGKEARAHVMQPYVESGNVYLPDPSIAPWIEDYIEEFRTFPNGAHDDQVDGSSQAIVWMLKKWNTQSGIVVGSYTRSTSSSHGRENEQPAHRDPRFA